LNKETVCNHIPEHIYVNVQPVERLDGVDVIEKNCQYCGKDSYSSYNDPDWRCPYCGKKLTNINRGESTQMCAVDSGSEKRFKIIQNMPEK